MRVLQPVEAAGVAVGALVPDDEAPVHGAAAAAHQPARRTTRSSLAAGVFVRLNRIRERHGLTALTVSPTLSIAAR